MKYAFKVRTVNRLLAATGVLLVTLGVGLFPGPAAAQVLLSPGQLDQVVARVALYPDPLLAQVLTAATYSDQIAEAAEWADQHSYLTGDNLAVAINQDNLPWDPSVLALLPFPSVLETMAELCCLTDAPGCAPERITRPTRIRMSRRAGTQASAWNAMNCGQPIQSVEKNAKTGGSGANKARTKALGRDQGFGTLKAI